MKPVAILLIVFNMAFLAYPQTKVTSDMDVKSQGTVGDDVLLVESLYKGTATDRVGLRVNSMQQPAWGRGIYARAGFQAILGISDTTGAGGRTGGYFVGGNGTGGNDQFGAECYAYNSNGQKIGVMGGAWGGTGINYGVYGAIGVGDSGYGVYCKGNGSFTGTWTQASDAKLKKEITPMAGALEKIKQLTPITFKYDTDKYPGMGLDQGKKFGFTAQNIEAVFPELVRTDVCPNIAMTANADQKRTEKSQPIEYKGVDYIGLIPVLLNAIQEQQKEIEELQAKLK